MITRRAVEADMDAVLALYRELRPHDPPLPHARAAQLWASVHNSPHSLIAVCEHEGQIGSTCMLALVANLASAGHPIGFIEHVVTASSLRRQGLGEACLQFTLAEAWRLGCCKIVLLSGTQRPQAHRLYEKLGFNGDTERGFVIKRPPP